MYIKQVIISNFKSYKEKTVFENLDRRQNVVVGHNGAGKSNFIDAILFVLSKEYWYLSSKQKLALLHEGGGTRSMSASVEITFDNPIENTETIIKRVISTVKDDYMLNNKHARRNEIVSLLESVGFSYSNPYYIVRQGKIAQLATASDAVRLKVLREIAGTGVYDENRGSALRLLSKAQQLLHVQCKQFQETIDQRINDLGEQRDELKEYQRFEQIHRVLESIIYDQELNENKRKLEKLQYLRNKSATEQEKLATELETTQDKIIIWTEKAMELQKELQILKAEQYVLNDDEQNLQKQKIKLQLIVKDLSEELVDDNKSKEETEKELSQLDEWIKESKTKLEQIKPEYEVMKKKEEELSRELTLKEQKRASFYAKQGRHNQFTTTEERDEWINNKLKSLNEQLKEKINLKEKFAQDLSKQFEEQKELSKKIEEHTRDLQCKRNSMLGFKDDSHKIKKNINQLQLIQNDLRRDKLNIEQNLITTKDNFIKVDHSLRSIIGKAIADGCDSIQKVLDEFRQRNETFRQMADSYYGLVIENLNCGNYGIPVEVTAGNKLFYHVVETDRVGTEILKETQRKRLPGTFNFMALNRMIVRDCNYPADPNVIPLVTNIACDTKLEKAKRFLFGRTLICRNLDVAKEVAKHTGLDCVTMDGDQISSKGALTGGYFNLSRSRLETFKKKTQLMKQINEHEDRLKKVDDELKKTDAAIDCLLSDMQKNEVKCKEAEIVYGKIESELRLIKEQLSYEEISRSMKKKSLTDCVSCLEAIQASIDDLKLELQQPMLSQLSESELAELERLNCDIKKLQQEKKKNFEIMLNLEAEKNELENLLTNNLLKRRDDMLCILRDISFLDRKSKLDDCKSELEEISKRLEVVNEQLLVVSNRVNAVSEKITSVHEEIEKLKQDEKDIQERVNETAKLLEKFNSKQKLLEQKVAECVEKIDNMAVLPRRDIRKQYLGMSSVALFKELEKINERLKQFSNVNKKAVDQILTFSDKRDELQKRKEELDKSGDSISELLNNLEQRKNDAILFTFKQISKYFEDIFKKLVPSGQAKLVIISKATDDAPPTTTNVDDFTGISVKVSFDETGAEMKELNALSGGQKSLVAFALIFAIQKCHPAPFYIFDEVDQALDAPHRHVVAEMIHELSNDAQFITTTFRPELLEHANKFYGIKFSNETSHVECISREEALNFVEAQETGV